MIIKNDSEAEIKFPLAGGKELVILPQAVIEIDDNVGKQILNRYGFCEEYIEAVELVKKEDLEEKDIKELREIHKELFGKYPSPDITGKKDIVIEKIIEEKNKENKPKTRGVLTVNEATQIDFKDEEIPKELNPMPMGQTSYIIIGNCYVPLDYAEILLLDKNIRMCQLKITQLKTKLKI